MDKLKALLGRGYFPVQLPPGFTSADFASKSPQIAKAWASHKPPSSRSEKFSVARSSYYRRVTRILNPTNFLFLSSEIVTYWSQIQKHYQKSRISLSRPEIMPGLRAIKISKFSDLYEAKITRSAGFRYVLVTDISSFFPTIYTHTIPWALHGKSIAKKNKEKTAQYFGNILDAKCMGVQDWQTVGLPIGPDTSHIIAEIIGVAIDLQLKTSLKRWPNGFRYVDDYYLFFDSRDEAEVALAELTKAVSNFELQLNPAKTHILEVKALVQESWKYTLKKLAISANKKTQRNDLHNYFEVLFSLEEKHSDESLIKYGLKQISSHIVKTSNWSIFEAYLLKCGFSFPNTLQVIATIFATYNKHRYPINKKAVSRFCNTLIQMHAVSDHHSEVSWLLWICKELQLGLRREVVREVEEMSSSVCSLIALDLYHSGVIKTNLTANYRKQFASGDALYGADWLLAYEAGRRGWLGSEGDGFIRNDDFFGPLFRENVEFYRTQNSCKPIFDIKNKELADAEIERLFDLDTEIEEFFEFDEMDEEYFDSKETEDDKEEDDEDFLNFL